MSGSVLVLDLGIIVASLVAVADQDGDARPSRFAIEDTREDLGSIGLVTLRDDLALTRTTTRKVWLQVVFVERDARRAPIEITRFPAPCASPAVVIRNSCPKLFPDI